jgi:hypothetical protein
VISAIAVRSSTLRIVVVVTAATAVVGGGGEDAAGGLTGPIGDRTGAAAVVVKLLVAPGALPKALPANT